MPPYYFCKTSAIYPHADHFHKASDFSASHQSLSQSRRLFSLMPTSSICVSIKFTSADSRLTLSYYCTIPAINSLVPFLSSCRLFTTFHSFNQTYPLTLNTFSSASTACSTRSNRIVVVLTSLQKKFLYDIFYTLHPQRMILRLIRCNQID